MFSNADYLAQLLVEAGLVTEEDVDSARGSLTGSETVIEHLLNSGALGQEDLASTLALNAGIDFVSLRESEIDPALVEQIPTDIAERFMCVPLKADGLTLKVAIPDPLNFETLDSLPTILNRELDFASPLPRTFRNTFPNSMRWKVRLRVAKKVSSSPRVKKRTSTSVMMHPSSAW